MIYLDNNATTPIAAEVLEEMQRVTQVGYGNPGSRHLAGRKARQILEEARESIAANLDAHPNEVIFTSGGTESSNLAIHGLTFGRQGSIVLPYGEHPATAEPVKRLQQRGCRQQKLKLTNTGQLEPVCLSDVVWDDVILASSILAHNETGTVLDLTELSNCCQEHRVPLHIDAVQAAGKIPVSFHDSGAATMSIGAHKFHGPRGIGALLVREGVKVYPQLLGGFQESGQRAGTEPVMLAAGMAKALDLCCSKLEERSKQLTALRDQLEAGLVQRCSPVEVNGDPSSRLPNTLNIAFPGCDADALLVALDLNGICCSHGSACASGSAEPSPVLVAMGCSRQNYESAIRFTVGIQNTTEEIENAIDVIERTVSSIRQ